MVKKIFLIYLLLTMPVISFAYVCPKGSQSKGPSLEEYEQIWRSAYKSFSSPELYFRARQVSGYKTIKHRLEAAWLLFQIIEKYSDEDIVQIATIDLSKLRSNLGRGISRLHICEVIKAQQEYVEKYSLGYKYYEPAGGYTYDPEPFARKLLKKISVSKRVQTMIILFKDMESNMSFFDNVYLSYLPRFENLIEESVNLSVYPETLLETLVINLHFVGCRHSPDPIKRASIENSKLIYEKIVASKNRMVVQQADVFMKDFNSKRLVNIGADRRDNLCVKYVDP